MSTSVTIKASVVSSKIVSESKQLVEFKTLFPFVQAGVSAEQLKRIAHTVCLTDGQQDKPYEQAKCSCMFSIPTCSYFVHAGPELMSGDVLLRVTLAACPSITYICPVKEAAPSDAS